MWPRSWATSVRRTPPKTPKVWKRFRFFEAFRAAGRYADGDVLALRNSDELLGRVESGEFHYWDSCGGQALLNSGVFLFDATAGFADRVVVVISQLGKPGTLMSATAEAASDGGRR